MSITGIGKTFYTLPDRQRGFLYYSNAPQYKIKHDPKLMGAVCKFNDIIRLGDYDYSFNTFYSRDGLLKLSFFNDGKGKLIGVHA